MTDSTVPTRLGFTTDDGFGGRATLGVIVLETDQTIEPELGTIHLDGVSFYHSRIPNDATVTRETLTAMKDHLPRAAAVLPSDFGFDAIGYGCTSAATLIGESAISDAIQSEHPSVPCTNPITAALAAFASLEATRIAVVTPYTADVTAPIVARFEDRGIAVPSVASFLEEDDLVVARISEASVAEAVRWIGGSTDCDAVFVSCTSLRAFGIIGELEAELGKAVMSSNSVFAWHLLRLAGVVDIVPGLGVLYERPLADNGR